MIAARLGKQSFFDSAAVTKAVDAATRRNLSRFGAFVRTRARSSIKQAPKIDVSTGTRLGPGRRKKGTKTRDVTSQPGQPPYSHVGYVKRFIFFAYDFQSRSVVIGPTLFGQGTVEALEKGGEVTIPARGRRKEKRVGLRARPFMQPAFEAELPGMMELWRDSVR